MADTVTPKWKEKYLEKLKRVVELEEENKQMVNVINDLRMLCNQQQEELRHWKHKHP